MIALARGSIGVGGGHWLYLAFLIPVSLACGNVFRTARWPAGMNPIRMAAGTTLSAGIILLLLTLVVPGPQGLASLRDVPLLATAQVLTSLLQFLFFFRLQWVGGPTYLSQIGYVAAAVGLAAGVLILGESYPPLVWAGAAAIAVGIVASNLK
jgi:drug/metabolite transporter (DMT)-like permease